MSAASSAQLRETRQERDQLARHLDELKEQLGRIKLICIDHATCDCSAAVMILDVIGDK